MTNETPKHQKHENRPDWDAHNAFIAHNKHYYHPSHNITMCEEGPLTQSNKNELARFGYKGKPGQVVHPSELGYYKFWKDRGGVKGCLVPEKVKQVGSFMDKYNPNSDYATNITFDN